MEMLNMWRKVSLMSVCLVVCVGVFSPVLAQDFRETTWGMMTAEVIRVEGDPALDQVNNSGFRVFGYERKLPAGETTHDVYALYYFVEDTLWMADYRIVTKHSNKNQYLHDFMTLKGLLNQKYGEVEPEIFWKNDLYKDDTDQWGLAVSVGHLALSSTWYTGTTKIQLSLFGDNYKIRFNVNYETMDQGLLELAEKQKQKQQDSAL